MNPLTNPFTPGAGSSPPELAGRRDVIEIAKISCGRAILGKNARSMMMLGLRGTGKTVLLGEIEKIGEDAGYLVSRIEAPEGEKLAHMLLPEMRKVTRSLSTTEAAKQFAERAMSGLRGFASVFNIEVAGISLAIEPEPGLADSGDIEFDLPDLFETIGKAAQAAGKGWLLLIDEVQYLSEKDLSALIVSLHRISQRGLPVVFAGAGLPQVAKLAGNAKSYAERLFLYPSIGALAPDEAAQAIRKPVEDEGAAIDEDALQVIVQRTQGYPFFLQELGSFAWDEAETRTITREDTENAYFSTMTSLDNGFFKVRFDRLTRSEIAFVIAMSELGSGPYPMSAIADHIGRTQGSLGPTRAGIIRKGMIYSTEHGFLDFTVPLFDEYLRRQNRLPDSDAALKTDN